MSDTRPNVLLIMDDQHNARCLSCYGNDDVQTPNIDALARDGTRFERAYCQNPICMPSRVSFLTGRYPHSHGVYGNYGSIEDETLSIANFFGRNGYDTGAFGKLHIPIDLGTHGFDTRRICDFADTERHAAENDYFSYLERLGYADDYDLGLGMEEYPHTTYVSNVPVEHSVETWTADETIRWLRDRESDDPFFAWTSFQRPHPPYSPPPEYADRYDPAEIDMPPRDDTEFESKPQVWQDQYESDLYKASDDADIRQVVAYYYELITLIDEQIGRVIDQLRESGELDNTIVVFASDHGDFAGEHGFVRKNLAISEAVHRIPFVWRWPEAIDSGTVRDDLVESVDLFPTLCDLVRLPTPDSVQGRSLADTLTGGERLDRDAVFCEDPDYRTVRTDEWKLTHYVGSDEGELYNVAQDPWEHDNLYDKAQYANVKAELQERLLNFYAETEDPEIPGNVGPPVHGRTEASHVFTRNWWEHGGRENPSPLHHLGSPGHPVDSDE